MRMTNIKNLIKINIVQMLRGIFTFSNKTKNKKGYGFAIVFILFGILIAFSFGTMVYPYAMILSTINLTEFIFIISGLMGFFFMLFFIMYESQGYLFKTKDYEQLASLPLTNGEIVISKFVSILISGYVYSLVLFAPSIVVYFMFAKLTVGSLLLAVLGFILFPIFPTAIGTLLGLLSSFISSKFKRSNLVNIILSFAFLIVYFMFYFSLNSLINSMVADPNKTLNLLKIYIPNIGFFITGTIRGNIADIFIFIIISLASISLVLMLVSSIYKKVNNSFAKNKALVVKKEISYKQQGIVCGLIKNESKRYFSSPVYVMNTLFGLIFAPALPIVLKLKPDIVSAITNSGFPLSIPTLAVLVACLVSSMCNTACVSISVEGKNFATLKSLPVKQSVIFTSKIIFNVLVVLPFLMLTNLLFLVLFFNLFTVLDIIAIIIIPITTVIAFATFGVILNLYMPKTDYDNMTQVVKQSGSSVIGVLLPMVLYIVLFSTILVNVNLPQATPYFNLVYLILFGVNVFVFTLSALLLKTNGKKLFNKINA